jgi:hypothetical protein
MPIIPPGAKVTQFSRDMVNRIAGSLSFFSSQSSQNAAPQQRRKEPWFGPGAPMRPLAPKADVAGRAYDYPASYNMGTRPRQYEGISFEMLEGLADGSDMVRLAIETRKDQMSKLGWKILPKMAPGQELRGPPDDRCALVQEALAFPDRRESWHMWQRRLIEEQLVTDAATIYCRPDLSGRPYAFEILHGRTIMPLLDSTGRMPHAPAPAFQQILHGMPAIDYSADELIYAPRNPRNGRAYGCSAVQQIIMTVNIANIKIEFLHGRQHTGSIGLSAEGLGSRQDSPLAGNLGYDAVRLHDAAAHEVRPGRHELSADARRPELAGSLRRVARPRHHVRLLAARPAVRKDAEPQYCRDRERDGARGRPAAHDDLVQDQHHGRHRPAQIRLRRPRIRVG